jgi:hypothetical protein
MKLCVNCKHYRPYHLDDDCAHPRANPFGLQEITGNMRLIERWRRSCERQREDGLVTSVILGTCGRRGRWFKRSENT